MRFGPRPLDAATGEILAHNISDDEGRRELRKGRRLSASDIERLRELGHREVYVASLEPGDVHEDVAACRVAALAGGESVEPSSPHTGRVNLTASHVGVVRVDVSVLRRLNQAAGVTVATLRTDVLARERERVASVKIIPYAIPETTLSELESAVGSSRALWVDPIPARAVEVLLVGSVGARGKMEAGIGDAIRERVEAMGCSVTEMRHVPLDEVALAEALGAGHDDEPALRIVAGETAIMDLDDLIPRGLRRAGGYVEDLGLAMDPGQLLLLAYLDDIPVVGAPGCVRGATPDGFDAVVPRLLAGERLSRADLHELAHGGLLSDPRRR